MSGQHSQPDREQFAAYLDGMLDDAARERLAAEIAAQPELQSEVARQQQIDGALRRVFAGGSMPAELLAKLRAAGTATAETGAATLPINKSGNGAAGDSSSRPAPQRRLLLASIGIAATIAWCFLGWRFVQPLLEREEPAPPMTVAMLYDSHLRNGFQPTWVCKDDHEFATTFQQRHGQCLVLEPMPADRKMVGLSYYGGLTPHSTSMLARVDGKPVIIFVDRRESDPHPADPAPESGLHLFRKELGPLVMYELTPLAQPEVMDSLKAVDTPPPASAPAPDASLVDPAAAT